MTNHLFVAFLLSLTVQSFALPIIRDVVGHNVNLSASVIEGIIIGIVVLLIIPLLWYSYKMCHRTPPNPTPLFEMPPPRYIANVTPNDNHDPNIRSPSARIIRPKKVHTKVNAPTSA